MSSAAKKLVTPVNGKVESPVVKPSVIRNSRPKPAPAFKGKLSVVTASKPGGQLATSQVAALKKSRIAMFICDLEWDITFANDKAYILLEVLEPTLKAQGGQWRSFKESNLLGTSVRFLFSDELNEFDRVSDSRYLPYRKNIQLGSFICDIFVDEIKAEDGTVTGYIVEWDEVTEQVREQEVNRQLVVALENCTTNVMLADRDLKLSYANKALRDNLKKWEPEFQAVFGAGFKADDLLGRCIDDFHKNPAHQRKMLANESMFPMQTMISVGPLRIELAVNVLKSPSGETIGYSTEWIDATERLRADDAYKANVKEISDRMEFLRGACSTDLATAMEALAEGDLTITLAPKTPLLEIPPQPDLALMAETFNALRNQTVKSVESYNKAKESLGALIAQAQISVSSITDASTEVMNGNDDLAQRTEEQAASLEETASSMEEMTSTVKQNADNAKQANQLASQARESAEKGGQVVGSAVSTMEEINAASKRIADIISVIDEIAFQTNLLALNAAVEAARVGEQGRGFAVVAAEVRNLAGRSATAAKEIKALVQDSVHKVQEGSGLVNQSGVQLEEIVTSVKKVADIISEIAAAAQEQSAGIEQVNKAITEMDQITQQNAALVEEASAASQSMNRQASDLQTVVDQFKLEDGFLAKMQTKIQAEQNAAAAAARKAVPTRDPRKSGSAQDAKPARRTLTGVGSGRATTVDLDEFEEF